MRNTTLFTAVALASFILAGCAGAAPLSGAPDRAEPMIGISESESFAAPAEESMERTDGGAAGDAASAPSAQERLVIRNANLSVVVEDPAQSVEDISQMAQGMGGYVVSSNISQSTFGDSRLGEGVIADRASITVRVPSERLDQAMATISDEAVEVRSQNVTGRDVTEEYTDLQARLRNLEAAEEQLREILDQAEETEDVLAVFEELRRVREEIEVVRGRSQFLQESAQLSSLTVELIPDVAAQPVQIGRWTPEGTAREALEALVGALQTIGDAAIWGLICVLPVVLLLGLPGYFVGRAMLRRRRAAKANAETAEAGTNSSAT